MEPVVDERVYSNRYQVTHLIARGGMAMVYRAHDLLLNRHVALKILYPELSVDRNFVERFRREAQAAANLSHPNIVPIFDWGEENGTYFIVMELIDGTSLAELLAGGRTLTPIRSAQVCAQVASALSYAHRQGVVHRDIKPGNILLTNDQQVKVTDFGIAQAVSTEDNLTVAGSVMGTATYFSPEQAEGAVVDGRSDVYSLGIVLYELLAGRPPFVGDSPVAVASKHVRDVAPSPRQFNAQLPSDIEAVVMHALAKAPADRYQSADELRADLMKFSEGQPVSVAGLHPIMGSDITQAVSAVGPATTQTEAVAVMTGPRTDVKRRRRRRGPWPWLVLLLVLALLGGGAYAYWEQTHKTFALPHVIGEKLLTAQTTLGNDGLSYLIIGVNPPKPMNNGIVLNTDPRPGAQVSKGQRIKIYYSQASSPPNIKVPPVGGDELFTAEAALTGAHLVPTVTYTQVGTGGSPPGTVISESPPAGTLVSSGQVVTLLVVQSGTPYQLVDVDGETISEASANLATEQLSVSPTQGSHCSNNVTSGDVASTVPPAQSLVTEGQLIELVISSGPCTEDVPPTTGDTEDQATTALEAAPYDYVPSYNELSPASPSCVQDGTTDSYVVNTTPAAGSPLAPDNSITVNYCPAVGANGTTTQSTPALRHRAHGRHRRGS